MMQTVHKKLTPCITFFFVLWALFSYSAPLHAQSLKKSASALPSLLTPSTPNDDVKISANTIKSQTNVGKLFEDAVSVEQGSLSITSNRASFNEVTGNLDLSGDVVIKRPGFFAKASQLEFNIDVGEGRMKDARYRLDSPDNLNVDEEQSTWGGKSAELVFDRVQNITLRNTVFTTCRNIDDPDWHLQTETLELDKVNEWGMAISPKLYFQGVPFLTLPFVSFPLSDKRRSGLLAPSLGFSSNKGWQFSQPIYWNIAPNRDAVFIPSYLSLRGSKIDSSFRYLEKYFNGEISYAAINDETTKTFRNFFSTQQFFNNNQGLSGMFEYANASDDSYLQTYANSSAVSSQRLLSQRVLLSYQNASWWDAEAQVQTFQLLQDPLAPITRPYDRLPQITLNTGRLESFGIEWHTLFQYTRFWQPDTKFVQNYDAAQNLDWKPQLADRVVINPSLSIPFRGSYYSFEPKVSYHYTRYRITRDVDPTRSFTKDLSDDNNTISKERAIPTYSLDSMLNFEREITLFDTDSIQTLEPRIFYVYTPFAPQAELPNFDSTLTNFGFTQLFSTNVYTGHDRIASSNALATVLTSRLLRSDNGYEYLRVMLGQQHYFTQGINNTINTDRRVSDLLFAAQANPTDAISVSSSAQYNPDADSLFRNTVEINWHPERKKTINLAYRLSAPDPYSDKTVDAYEASGQWPLNFVANGWYGVYKASYSRITNSFTETIVGLEYNADCWVFRIAAQRFATAAGTKTSAYFLQLELGNWLGLGVSPTETLRSNIANFEN